jgi:hypothetical protein
VNQRQYAVEREALRKQLGDAKQALSLCVSHREQLARAAANEANSASRISELKATVSRHVEHISSLQVSD